jgi:hypothetical protein
MNLKAKTFYEFIENGKEFKKGDIFTVKNEAVYDDDVWICDVGSPFFKGHFEIISE